MTKEHRTHARIEPTTDFVSLFCFFDLKRSHAWVFTYIVYSLEEIAIKKYKELLMNIIHFVSRYNNMGVDIFFYYLLSLMLKLSYI